MIESTTTTPAVKHFNLKREREHVARRSQSSRLLVLRREIELDRYGVDAAIGDLDYLRSEGNLWNEDELVTVIQLLVRIEEHLGRAAEGLGGIAAELDGEIVWERRAA